MSIAPPAPEAETPPVQKNGKATLSFVLGLVSLVINPLWATSIVGGIFGIIALAKPHDSRAGRKAVLGIVFSVIGLFTSAALLALTIFAVTGIATGAKSVSSGSSATPAATSFASLTEFKDALVKAGYSCPNFEQSDQMSGAKESGSCSTADVLSLWSSADEAKAKATDYFGASDYLIYGGNWILNTSDSGGAVAQSALGGTVVDQSTSSDSTDSSASTFDYNDTGLTLTLKTKSKKCFGSAGCSLVVAVNLGVEDPSSIPDDASGEVTYTITGGDDGPVIGTIDITGTSYNVPQEAISTSSTNVKLKVKATDITTN